MNTKCTSSDVKCFHRLTKIAQIMQNQVHTHHDDISAKSCCLVLLLSLIFVKMLHFCKFLTNRNFSLETEYNFQKANNRRFQQYTVHTEILSICHEWVKDISALKNMPFKPMGTKNPETSPSLEARGPHLIRSSLNRPHSSLKTVSRSNQPFCQNTLSGPTDRQTDRSTDRPTDWMTHRWDRRQLCTKSTLHSCSMEHERCTNDVCNTSQSTTKAAFWHHDYLCTDILQIRSLLNYQDVGPLLVQNHCHSLTYTADVVCKLFMHVHEENYHLTMT